MGPKIVQPGHRRDWNASKSPGEFVVCFVLCFCLSYPSFLSFSLSVPVNTSSTKPLLSKMAKLVFVLPFVQLAQIRTETSWSRLCISAERPLTYLR